MSSYENSSFQPEEVSYSNRFEESASFTPIKSEEANDEYEQNQYKDEEPEEEDQDGGTKRSMSEDTDDASESSAILAPPKKASHDSELRFLLHSISKPLTIGFKFRRPIASRRVAWQRGGASSRYLRWSTSNAGLQSLSCRAIQWHVRRLSQHVRISNALQCLRHVAKLWPARWDESILLPPAACASSRPERHGGRFCSWQRDPR